MLCFLFQDARLPETLYSYTTYWISFSCNYILAPDASRFKFLTGRNSNLPSQQRYIMAKTEGRILLGNKIYMQVHFTAT